MKKLFFKTTATLVLLTSGIAFAGTTKECIARDGCIVVETLPSGLQIEHKLDVGDEYETGSGASYIWKGGSTKWKPIP